MRLCLPDKDLPTTGCTSGLVGRALVAVVVGVAVGSDLAGVG